MLNIYENELHPVFNTEPGAELPLYQMYSSPEIDEVSERLTLGMPGKYPALFLRLSR